MTNCPICEHSISPVKLTCPACRTSYEGEFIFPRLARLNTGEQHLAEALIEHGGNLKEMAETLGISYPTLKKKLNELSKSLKKEKAKDERAIEEILKEIELGKVNAKEGIKRIREINGEL